MPDEVWNDWIIAASDGDLQRLADLLAAGIDINASDRDGQTGFSYACAYNSLGVARFLYGMGADVNAALHNGLSPLDCTSTLGSADLREWLIGVGGRRNWHFEGAAEYEYNNAQVIVSAPALVRSKRSTEVRLRGEQEEPTRSYFVTFQFDSETERELGVSCEEFASLTEGARGLLNYQGTRYCDFVPD
jgi:hypothetical protein